jgi:hypothetical protein
VLVLVGRLSWRWILCIGKAWRCDVYSVCDVVFQTDGVTPLYIACQNGHVECVRALLGAGAAINTSKVGCACSMARCCGGTVRGDVGGTVRGDVLEPALMHV